VPNVLTPETLGALQHFFPFWLVPDLLYARFNDKLCFLIRKLATAAGLGSSARRPFVRTGPCADDSAVSRFRQFAPL
jgi:hypothetical protein